ncbi:unnamed protein product [Boreogadus saida]
MLGSQLCLMVLLGAVVPALQQRDQWSSLDHSNDYNYVRHDEEVQKTFCSWDCLKFTLQWPGAFCTYLNETAKCVIPPEINTWTIHGLWPQKVYDCCSCWHLFPSDLEDLDEELSQEWPSFVKSKSYFQFWKLEWHKHGACAACVEGLNSPIKYFSLCLKLRQQFDITRALSEGSVVPSCDRPYKLAELEEVLTPLIGEHHEIQCIQDNQDRELWFQVKIPLSRNLTLGCPQRNSTAERGPPPRGHPCPSQTPIYLVPIDHENPREPCG